MRLEEEIKTQFKDEYHKLVVNLIYTQNQISQGIFKLLKPYGLSNQQYNILRILRGQHPKPCNINLLLNRMLDKMSNASRLVEKLRQKGLVERQKNEDDARNRDVMITEKGLMLLKEIEPKMDRFAPTHCHLSENEAKQLNVLLDKLRSPKQGEDY